MNIGSNLKIIRNRKQLTQKQLAEMIEVSTITIQNYENNRREPKMDTLNKIAETLNISVNELLNYEELEQQRIQFIRNYYKKYPDDKKISNIVKKINDGEALSDEDIQDIDGYKKADIIARDFDTYDVPCVRGPENEAFDLFKRLLKSLGYTYEDLGCSDIVLFARIKAQIELEIKMANENKEKLNGNI